MQNIVIGIVVTSCAVDSAFSTENGPLAADRGIFVVLNTAVTMCNTPGDERFSHSISRTLRR